MNKKIVGLVLLSAFPSLAGLARVLSLSVGSPQLDGHARFAADPWTAALHIIGATAFATVGAFQFVPSLRRGAWHRLAGRVLSVLGLAAIAAGMWMTLRWEPKAFDGPVLTLLRTVVSVAMVSFVMIGVRAARRGDITGHGRWMTRAYALFLGPGTQVVTLGVTELAVFDGHRTEFLLAALMAAGWVINSAFAEYVLRDRTPTATQRQSPQRQWASSGGR